MVNEPARVIVGELAPPADGPPGASPYQVVKLAELHEIGADGHPAKHRTIQTIRALADGIATHRYAFDLGEARVEAIHGGTPGDPYRIKGNLWAVELILPRTLDRGDEHRLEYVTTFRDDGPIVPRLRRAAHHRVQDAVFEVKFHPDRLPRQVWWAHWADYRDPDDRIVERVPVRLDDRHTVSHRVDVLERAVAGFVWEFDQG